MSTSACSKLLGTLSGRGVPSERLPLQYKHQWLISAVNATGDGMSLWYNGKKSQIWAHYQWQLMELITKLMLLVFD